MSNPGVVCKCWTGENVERGSRLFSGILSFCAERLKKVKNVFNYSSPSPGRDSNPNCHEHEVSPIFTPSKSFSSTHCSNLRFPALISDGHSTVLHSDVITMPYKFLVDILYLILPLTFWNWYPVSRDSSIGIVTGCGLDDRAVGFRIPVGSRIFFSPRRPDLLSGPPSLLSNGHRELFPRGKAAGAWSWALTSNYCRGQGNVYLCIHSPIRLHCVVLK
jgi:hypothetical protein